VQHHDNPAGRQKPVGRGRVPYKVAGEALRELHARARVANLTPLQWRVLSAVVDLTVSYSRLEDSVYLGVITTMVYDDEPSLRWQQKKVSKILGELEDLLGLQAVAPPPGRPKTDERPRYRLALKGARPGPLSAGKGAGPVPEREPEPAPERSRARGPYLEEVHLEGNLEDLSVRSAT
jgi:hypothetical protein